MMETAVAADARASCARRDVEYRGVLYAGLMLDARRPEGARVQRALRRPRVPGRRPAARERPRPCTAAKAADGPARDRRSSSPTTPASASCSRRGLSARARAPRRRHRAGSTRRPRDDGVIVFHAGHRQAGDDGSRHDATAAACSRSSAVGPDVASARDARVRGRGPDLVARRPLPSRHRSPGAPVIPRYSLPEIADLFTDEARFGAWLEVEVLAVEAWAAARRRPGRRRAADPRARRASTSRRFTSARRVTDHDVAAFVDVVQATRRPARRRVGALRPHLERRRRHRARAADDPRRRPASSARPPTSRRRSRRGPASSATRRWSAARTASTPSRPPSAPSSRSGRCRCAAIANGSRGPVTRSRSASCRARSARTPTSIPRSSAYVCEQLGLVPVPATQVLAARPPRRGALRVRVGRREHRVVRARDPPLAAHRGARGRGAVPRGRAKGLERDAAQAQPDQVGAAQRSGTGAARQPPGRARRRRAVARARHLALVGRAHHHPRLADARVLHDRADSTRLARGPARVSRAHVAQPRRVVRPRVQPARAARAHRERARAATTPTGSCSAMRCATWQEERSFRELLVADPEVTRPRSTRRASTPASTSSARWRTSGARSTRSIALDALARAATP